MLAQDSDAINAYAVHGAETGGRAPVSYPEVLAALPARSQLCWPLHAACSGKTWLLFPDTLDFTRPQEEWYSGLTQSVLTLEEVKRVDQKVMRIFTAYEAQGEQQVGAVAGAGQEGRALDKGCLSDEDRALNGVAPAT